MKQKLIDYLFFWRPNKENNTTNFNLKVMHGINKISILMFLLAVVFILFKYLLA